VIQASGIDSPGLTSSLAVGKLVAEIVADGT
jgi:glycine/D-amino acid oxidase-like deaminating enzyme